MASVQEAVDGDGRGARRDRRRPRQRRHRHLRDGREGRSRGLAADHRHQPERRLPDGPRDAAPRARAARLHRGRLLDRLVRAARRHVLLQRLEGRRRGARARGAPGGRLPRRRRRRHPPILDRHRRSSARASRTCRASGRRRRSCPGRSRRRPRSRPARGRSSTASRPASARVFVPRAAVLAYLLRTLITSSVGERISAADAATIDSADGAGDRGARPLRQRADREDQRSGIKRCGGRPRKR